MQKFIGKYKFYLIVVIILAALIVLTSAKTKATPKDTGLDDFRAQPFISLLESNVRIKSAAATATGAINPSTIKAAYNLPAGNVGSGTIAIVDAYDNPNAEADLAVFNQKFNLPACTTQNGCFTKVKMKPRLFGNTGWGLEENLDVQWAHAIAPAAKIMLVEAASDSGTNLMNAVSYASSQPGVVAVSMSWGGSEFLSETNYDNYFSKPGVQFFAASGDSGHATSWPAVSANVIAVGGTTLNLDATGKLLTEIAWSGSGGGVSKYVAAPSWQQSYGISNSSGKRAMPDVSYNADPNTGYPVYDSYGRSSANSWLIVGGTSAGTPQWAAIQSIGRSIGATKLYIDAKSGNTSQYFRDIISGLNGSCGALCIAGLNYDFVSGLGSPLTQQY